MQSQFSSNELRSSQLKYLAYLRRQGCIICGLPAEAHHLVAVGSGGGTADDFSAFPLCRIHHSECHNNGVQHMNHKYRLDMWQIAHRLFRYFILHRTRFEVL